MSTEHLYEALCAGHPFSFWLDAGAGAADGFSYLGTGDELVVQGDASAIRASGGPATGGGQIVTVADIGAYVRQRFTPHSQPGPWRPSLGGFAPGWVGFLGYEWRADASSTTPAPPSAGDVKHGASHAPAKPEAAFLHVTRLLVVDHAARTLAIVWRGDDEGEGWAGDVAASLETGSIGSTSTSTSTSTAIVIRMVA